MGYHAGVVLCAAMFLASAFVRVVACGNEYCDAAGGMLVLFGLILCCCRLFCCEEYGTYLPLTGECYRVGGEVL